jgi:ABC-type sulfate transport system permease subunit
VDCAHVPRRDPIGPLLVVFYRTFENGFDAAWAALSSPETIHAFKLTLIITAIAVPANTVFGIACGIAIVRRKFRGKGIVNAFVDLPLALSPSSSGSRSTCSTAVTAGSALALRPGIQVLFASRPW